MNDVINLLGIVNARGYFNGNKNALRTFDEATHFVTGIDWHRGKGKNQIPKRNILYLLDQEGYLPWRLNILDNGISNYGEDAILSRYQEIDEERFVEDKRLKDDSIGFLPMDSFSLENLIRNGNFDENYLKHWVGIDKRHLI